MDLINFYRVKDLDETKMFYEEVIGLEIYKDQGKCIIYEFANGKLGFCSHFPDEISATSCITFVYDDKSDVDDMYNRLSERNIEVQKMPEVNEYFKIYHFFVLDPSGLKLEFQYFLK